MKTLLKALPILVLIMSLVALSRIASADGAPPVDLTSNGGVSPSGYQYTEVQMVYERVEMELQVVPNLSSFRGEEHQITVSAWFIMHNQGDADESMQVIFPLVSIGICGYGAYLPPNLASSEYSYVIDEDSFRVSVDGKIEPTELVITPNPDLNKLPPGCADDPIRWAGFDVTFPVDQDVILHVAYTMTSDTYGRIERVQYILETGAGWKGPIGRADIIFRLPYLVNYDNILKPDGHHSGTTPGYQSQYNQISWSYSNLEPTIEDNIVVAFLSPFVWQEVQGLRAAIQADPQDVIDWFALIDLYSGIAGAKGFKTPDNFQYYDKLDPTYQQAMAANPDNAELFAQYAWFLFGQQGPFPEYIHPGPILPYLNRALALDPDNEIANLVLEELKSAHPELEYTPPPTVPPTITLTPAASPLPTSTPTLTLTSTPRPTRTWTATYRPSKTPRPSATSSPTPTPFFPAWIEQNGSGSIWLVLIVVGLLLGAGMVTWWSVKNESRSGKSKSAS
jgi:tetratricopeptide (TPR) repeat protein